MPIVSPSDASAVCSDLPPHARICVDCQVETWLPIGPLDAADVRCRHCFRRARSIFRAPTPRVHITRLPELPALR